MEKEVTYYSFLSHIKAFLRSLLNDPVNCKVDDFFIENNLSKSKLIFLLKNKGIIIASEKIDDSSENDKNDTIFKIKYLIPRKNFERKIKRLYSKLFEVNIPDKHSLYEDGEGSIAGATSAVAVNNCAPVVPFGQVNRRKIYITDEQLKRLEEQLTTFNAGDYQYDVPFIFKDKNEKKDDAYIHNKKGGISVEVLK